MDCFLSSFSLIFLSCIKNALSRVCKKANDSTDRLISIQYRHWSVNNWLIWSFTRFSVSFMILWKEMLSLIEACDTLFKLNVMNDRHVCGHRCPSESFDLKMQVQGRCRIPPLTLLFAFVCHRWDGILSAVSAPFTAFLEPITRLSPPHQPWVSTHWRTVKNLLSLSCISQEGVHVKECFHFQGCFVCIRYACKAARARLWCIVVEVICWSWTERGNHCKDAIA